MKKIISLALIICMSISGSLAFAQGKTDEEGQFLARIFNYANAHDLKALEGLKGEVNNKKDRLLTSAYFLALYMAAPAKYKQQYIDNFPVDYEGLHYLYLIEIAGLIPSSFSYIHAIGLIAAEGNDKAIEKVIIGNSHSDGGPGELFCDVLSIMYKKQLQKTVRVFTRMDEGVREKALECFRMMDAKEIDTFKARLKNLRSKAAESERKAIDEMINYQ